MIRSRIIGSGSYLPKNCVTNDDLSEVIETTHEWIVQRTGIAQRHFSAEDEMTSDLGYEAAKQAIANASLEPNDIDMIIVGTATPDRTLPATAIYIQKKLGITTPIPAFDINAACSGFIYAISIADNFIKASQAKRVLVIGAETLSSIIDTVDRSTYVLFGDGAGAVVLEASTGNGTKDDTGILATLLHADASTTDILRSDGGVGLNGKSGTIQMEGKDVFKNAVTKLASVVDEILEREKIGPSEIDWFVPHQANKRIIDAMAKKLKISPDRVVYTIAEHANTSAASVPLALSQAINDGRIKKGQLILVEALGAGLTWGAGLIRL
ncbi:MAG: beta-ketoacyl-ACP synthase III [Alphaproteobacteria bacterium]